MKNIKYYLIVLLAIGIFSCSEDDPSEETGTDSERNELITNNFLATIETWSNLPYTSIEWEHEYNNDGKLVQSTMYEKYPKRIVWELFYLDHNEDLLPTSYEKAYYSYGEQEDFITWDVSYNENNTINGLSGSRDDSPAHEWIFSQLDEENRVISVLLYDETGEFDYREVYDFGANNNRSSRTRFDIENENGETDFVVEWDYSYTNFGDYRSVIYIDREYDAFGETTYQYRNDNTLESSIYVSVAEGSPDYESQAEYDEEERMTTRSVTQGENRWEYTYFPNGEIEVMETYVDNVLNYVITFSEDRSSEEIVFHPDDGTYEILFRDTTGTVYKVEYYDAEDNLLDTEYYSGNVEFNKLPVKMKDKIYKTAGGDKEDRRQ